MKKHTFTDEPCEACRECKGGDGLRFLWEEWLRLSSVMLWDKIIFYGTLAGIFIITLGYFKGLFVTFLFLLFEKLIY